jgi:hypothetical protein
VLQIHAVFVTWSSGPELLQDDAADARTVRSIRISV